MSQISFSDAEYAGERRKTRRQVFLQVPWPALLKLISPRYPRPAAAAGRTSAMPARQGVRHVIRRCR